MLVAIHKVDNVCFWIAEKYISVCISLAKFGRQKACQEDYIFKKSRRESTSSESNKYACIQLVWKMFTCRKNLGTIMKQR